jgi:hypothetical protein
MRKKTVKLTKKNLTICPDCGRPKVKDERVVSDERAALIDENLEPHKMEGLTLK